jgi:hypothetical protein
MRNINYKEDVITFLKDCKEGRDEFNAEVVRVMELNNIKDKTIQSNYKTVDMQYLLDGMDKCEFTDEQYKWIEQMLIFADQGSYYATMKEVAPKAFEKKVKEEVKGWGNFKGLKF